MPKIDVDLLVSITNANPEANKLRSEIHAAIGVENACALGFCLGSLFEAVGFKRARELIGATFDEMERLQIEYRKRTDS